MRPHEREKEAAQEWPFALPEHASEDEASVNKRMLRHISARMRAPGHSRRVPVEMVSLGLEVRERRRENGWSRSAVAVRSGLDLAFLTIVEAGSASQEEVTPDVIHALARGLRVASSKLEAVFAATHHEQDALGRLVRAVLSLAEEPFFMAPSMAKAAIEAPDHAEQGMITLDEVAGVSYRLRTEGKPQRWYLLFYSLDEPHQPLPGWAVSLRVGVREITSGRTDDEGRFAIPMNLTELPIHAYLVLTPPQRSDKEG